jgi:type I restriction enzyme S subunit
MKNIPLGEILKLEYGKPLSKEDRTECGKYPAYGANGIKARTDKFYVDERGIIVGRKGSAGAVTLTDGPFWPLDVTYHVTFDKLRYDLKYIYWLLKTLNLTSLAVGVKPGINRNEVYTIEVPAPGPIEQQRQIVVALDTAFDKIDRVAELTKTSQIDAKKFFESKLNQTFTNTNTWNTSRLGAHIKFIDYRGRTPKKHPFGLRLITAKNIKMGYIQDEPREYIDPADYDTWMTRGIPRKDDILFTTEAPLGNVALLNSDDKIAFAQRTIIFQMDRKIYNPRFLKYLMLSKVFQDKVIEKGTGTTVLGIKSKLLKEIVISYPKDVEAQKELSRSLENAEDMSRELHLHYQKKLDNLSELKKMLLDKALKNEL